MQINLVFFFSPGIILSMICLDMEGNGLKGTEAGSKQFCEKMNKEGIHVIYVTFIICIMCVIHIICNISIYYVYNSHPRRN